jgi:hypothetical protein
MASQLSLFSATEQWQVNGRVSEGLSPEMSLESLQVWQDRLGDFQRSVRFLPTEAQASLFDLPSFEQASPEQEASGLSSSLAVADAEYLDPFGLPQRNINFWKSPIQEAGVAALYFVIDYERSLLLYVGETVHSNQRWKGVHDCKRYLANYRQVHYAHDLTTQLGIAFWPHAPLAARARQRLESKLILRWRSPFNKENWRFWGTPFVGGKIEA